MNAICIEKLAIKHLQINGGCKGDCYHCKLVELDVKK